MDRKASIELSVEDKSDTITPLGKTRVTLDSYIVPVVFEKPSHGRKGSPEEREEEGRIADDLGFDTALSFCPGGGEKYACVVSETPRPELQAALEVSQ